jgi:acetyl coenzyme A synthetase (ADP forming)-like protein
MHHPPMAATSARVVRDVILRDGRTLRLRPPGKGDTDALVEFFGRLSPESRYLRFHGIAAVDSRLAHLFVEPDWNERGALLGSLADDGTERVVALASYARLRDPAGAEVAFAVEDELQGRGIGTRLLEQLALLGAEHGLEYFVAEVLPRNTAMLKVLGDAGFEVTRALEDGTYEVRVPIAPTEGYVESVDTRDHVAVVASLRPFFQPASVAVIGASRRHGSIGGELFRNILAADFEGTAYPVNRGAEAVAGVKGYSSVADVPERVDLAVICLPGAAVLEAADEALRTGCPALCVISAGFAELGPEGVERQETLLELVRSHGARLIGPNCLGVSSAAVRLNATFAPRAFPPGRIGFSSQSGALGLALLERAGGRNVGFSAFVSIGNKADVSSNDLLEYWEEDEETDVVLLYLESFGNPRKFARLARRVARSKPILAMKSGTTRAGARAASSHTAALAGSDAAVDALFEQAGVLRARTLDELIDAATLLAHQPVPRGRRVALLTNAGGLGILGADACEAAGLELPSPSEESRAALAELLPVEAGLGNPIDMLGSANAKSYANALPILLADSGIDSVIALFVPPVAIDEEEVGAAIAQAAEGTDKTLLVAFVSAKGAPETLRRSTVPVFPYPESAAKALGRAVERADWLRRPVGRRPALGRIDYGAARALVDERLSGESELWLPTDDVRALLSAYGLPVVPEHIVESADAAVAAADELGYSVVLKTAEAGVHKTERGGVALGLGDERAVREAAERIGGSLIVQPMISSTAELLAGVLQDPMFGPLVAFGPGGVLAELIGQAGFRLAPLSDVDASELVQSGKVGTLVRGFRGKPHADEAALVDLLLRLSRLAEEIPEAAELDLNPVLAREEGCVVVDARIRLSRPPAHVEIKSW